MTSPSATRMLVRLLILTLVSLAAAPSARAQPRPLPADVGPLADGKGFVIQSCGESGASTGWQDVTNTNPTGVATGHDCPPSDHIMGDDRAWQQAGIWVTDRLGATGGWEAAAGDHAEIAFTPLPGTTITRLRWWRLIVKQADNNWQPYTKLGPAAPIHDTCEIVSSGYCAAGGDDWYPNDSHFENNRTAYEDLQNLSTSKIVAGLYCRDDGVTHVCGNGYSLVNVQVNIFSAFITISDTDPPTAGTPSGTGWTTTDWVQGTLPLSLDSTDLTGISATRVYADGSLIATLQRPCAYTRPRPCTDEGSGAVGLPTAGLGDGAHTIELAAVDAAGNERRITRPAPLEVDNTAPATPVGIRAAAAVSAVNRFDISWSLPADAGTPITAARYQLCQGAACGAVQTSAAPTSISGLVVPAPGTYTLRTWLVDAQGHEAPGSAASVALTYAPEPPAQPAPVPVLPQPPATTPAPPTAKTDAALRITTVRRIGRRVTVGGRLTTRASGHVTIRYRVRIAGRTRVVSHRAAISKGTFRATFTLSPMIGRPRTATIQVAYAGDSDTRSATRASALRLTTTPRRP